MEIKYFTPYEAKRTLPLVKQIVKDILAKTKEIKAIADEIDGDIREHPEIVNLLEQLNNYLQELEDIGCHFKDWNFSTGLIDFPSVIEGEEVFLCWKSDEEDIKYYHGINSGYSNRKPIPEVYI
jgi:hypothetical protein